MLTCDMAYVAAAFLGRRKQDATARPQNTQLYVRETEDLMDGFGGLGWNPFEEWWTAYLAKKQ